jgi:hypothetical protein
MTIIYEMISKERPDGITTECVKATLEDGSVLIIPLDPANSDYAAYLEQLDKD